MKKKLKVAVIFNEPTPELYIKPDNKNLQNSDFVPYFEIDDLTPVEEYELMAERLCNRSVDAYTLNIKDDIDILLKNIKKNKPDVVFNFVEIYKDNARLEMNMVGLLELLGIPYTGAPPMALANCQSKILAKRLLNAVGLPTPQFMVVRAEKKQYRHKLNFPLIVKPAFEDASSGIENDSIVTNNKDLKNRINYVLQYFAQPALVEEFIEGRELNVAVMGDKEPFALPISEIDFTEMPDHLYNIVSYQAKWDPHHESYHKTIPVCPAELPKKIEKKAQEIAIKAFKTMTCRDYARIDMRLTKDNKLFVLEVNPNPDLTEGAGFMRSADAFGYNYTTALKKIINFAWKRRKKK
ncbi:MAG TPA: ATP-grasp domain-containing protein [Ignavibacteriaceae bacterium]|nr:ATP-grasp domain-containing protein [Ignavibacteriaceae bacterium]